MTIYSQLPIYRVAYDLLSVAVDLVQNMPRPFKAAIGGRLRDLCIDVVLLVFRANCARNKVPHLEALLERLEELQLLLRISQDKRFISRRQYAQAVELTTSVGKLARAIHAASADGYAGYRKTIERQISSLSELQTKLTAARDAIESPGLELNDDD